MPHWALGRLMDLAEDLAGMTRSMNPPVARKTIVTMAGDHGVVAEGVSKYPQVVTLQMVHNFVTGGAGINALARVVGARVVVVDMGAAGDLKETGEAGKDRFQAHRTGHAEYRARPGDEPRRRRPLHRSRHGTRAGTGRVHRRFRHRRHGHRQHHAQRRHRARPSPAARPQAATGRGTGIDSDQLRHKVSVVERALEVNKPDPSDGLDVLAKVGGFEIGGIAGLILGAAAQRKPVLVDGFISTAGALIAQTLSPGGGRLHDRRPSQRGDRARDHAPTPEEDSPARSRTSAGRGDRRRARDEPGGRGSGDPDPGQRRSMRPRSPRRTHETLPRGDEVPDRDPDPRKLGRGRILARRQRGLLSRGRTADRARRGGNRRVRRPLAARRSRRGARHRGAAGRLRRAAHGRPLGHGRRAAERPAARARAGDHARQPRRRDGRHRHRLRADAEIRRRGLAAGGGALAHRPAHAGRRPRRAGRLDRVAALRPAGRRLGRAVLSPAFNARGPVS